MKKWLIVMSFVLMFSTMPPVQAAETFSVNADGAILIDAETGQILHQQNADAALGLASVSKLMTVFIVLDHIRSGELKWDDTYKVSKRVHELSTDMSLGNVALVEGREYTIRELYESILIFSANASTVGLTEKIAGSEEAFMPYIKKKAKELDLQQINFVNATGLNNVDLQGQHLPGTGPSDENVMSTKDVAKIAYHMIKTYPEVLEITKQPRKVFGAGTENMVEMTSWNYMLPGYLYEYEGVDGLKTGNTTFAGQCFVGTVQRDGTRYIGVVLNARDKDNNSTYDGRFGTMKELFDYAFTTFNKTTKADKDTVTEVKVDGKEAKVKLAAALPFYEDKHANTKIKVVAAANQHKGKIKEGDIVGTAHLAYADGKEITYLAQPPQVDLVATDNVHAANKTKAAAEGAGNFFSRVWNTISNFVSNIF